MRERSFEITHLDRAGMTLHATPPIHSSRGPCTDLYGNYHSPLPSSLQITKRMGDIRHRVLHTFYALPEEFDVVFCTSARTRIKLLLKAFTAQNGGFRYRSRVDAHTSLVGMPEPVSKTTFSFSDTEVEIGLKGPYEQDLLGQFALPV